MKTKVVIIGGGFAAASSALMLSKRGGVDITLVEASNELGAGVRTKFKGGHPYTFGPRHFLTQSQIAFDYLNDIIPLRLCSDHEFKTYVEKDGNFYNYPIHIDDVKLMPDGELISSELAAVQSSKDMNSKTLEDYWINSVGNTLYNKFVNSYSKKMWDVKNNNEIDDFGWSPKGVALKKGPRAAWDTAISAYPISHDGYNQFFDLAQASINNVQLSEVVKRVDFEKNIVYTNKNTYSYDILINTISPDILFEFCYGELPYMGRDLELVVLPVEYALPKSVYFCYYAGLEKFTRVTEYKKFYKYESPSTLISIEYPSKNGRHYPMPFKIEYMRADKYFNDMPANVYSIGRAGSYRYSVDIDDCILQSMDVMNKI